jgi:predicted nucleotidyltransferase
MYRSSGRTHSERAAIDSGLMPEHARIDNTLIARLQSALRDGPPLRLAVLFGSAAAGRRRPDSDVDVAIQAPASGVTSASERALARALALAAGAEVDLVHLENASTLLKWLIATTGVPLSEASPGEFARFRARAAAEYIDYAPAAAYHGEIFRRRLIEQRPAP